MHDLLFITAHNTVIALILAVVVYGITRIWRNPPLAHALWLLVLIKLVALPIVCFDWTVFSMSEITHGNEPTPVDWPRLHEPQAANRFDSSAAPPTGDAPVHVIEHEPAGGMRQVGNAARMVLPWVWFGGATVWAGIIVVRITRFQRRLRDMLPASERINRLTFETAIKIGLRRLPDVRYTEDVTVPLVWCIGRRATIVLPTRLLKQLDDRQTAMILAHELAHLRRRDHWVRVVELVVSIVHWWNPLVWIIRRQLHQAEDLCCDAWVRWMFANGARHYAELVLKTAESVTALRSGAQPLPASLFLQSVSLKARIEMILESRFAPHVSKTSLFVIVLLALFILPLSVQATQKADQGGTTTETPATPAGDADPTSSAGFPYKVSFEQGATQFLDGDDITILEIHGTADTISPGNIYLIKGKYRLASHDRAMLAAFTTARESKDGTGPYLKVQTTVVDQGDGTFTLYLPMMCGGWPHVSFYSVDGADDGDRASQLQTELMQAPVPQIWEIIENGRGELVEEARRLSNQEPGMEDFADQLEKQLIKVLGPRRGSQSGGSFGGNYFGTGESVLTKWWGSE